MKKFLKEQWDKDPLLFMSGIVTLFIGLPVYIVICISEPAIFILTALACLCLIATYFFTGIIFKLMF